MPRSKANRVEQEVLHLDTVRRGGEGAARGAAVLEGARGEHEEDATLMRRGATRCEEVGGGCRPADDDGDE
eukprot:3514932-Rhodomonas_salina.1